jgi:hypothetical protein
MYSELDKTLDNCFYVFTNDGLSAANQLKIGSCKMRMSTNIPSTPVDLNPLAGMVVGGDMAVVLLDVGWIEPMRVVTLQPKTGAVVLAVDPDPGLPPLEGFPDLVGVVADGAYQLSEADLLGLLFRGPSTEVVGLLNPMVLLSEGVLRIVGDAMLLEALCEDLPFHRVVVVETVI